MDAPDQPRRYRIDAGGTLQPPREHPSGYVEVDGRFARTGPQTYQNEDGTERIELRLPEEVFSAESLATWRGVPVTDTHPPELVTPDNARRYQRGAIVGDVAKDEGEGGEEWIRGALVIHDGEALAAARRGRVELSAGYTCELAPPDPSLVARWGRHDAIQRRIAINHLALVDTARAGPQARIRIDAAGNATIAPVVRSDPQAVTTTGQEITMPELKIDGAPLPLTTENAAAIQTAIDRAIASARADGEAKTTAERTRADGEKARADAAEKARANLRAHVARHRARLDAMGGKSVSCDACAGSGMVSDAKCDACDGAGKYSVADMMILSPMEKKPEELEADAPPAEEAPEKMDAALAPHLARVRTLWAKRDKAIAAKARADERARLDLETSARKVLGAGAKFDGQTEAQIQRAVIERVTPGVVVADAEVAGAYRVALAVHDAQPSAVDRARLPAQGGAAPVTSIAAARAAMIETQTKIPAGAAR